MHWLTSVDWGETFKLDTSLPEIVIRGTLVYLALFFLMRFVLKREAAGLGITDLLVIVLIADAAQNAMAGDYKSVPDGVLLVGVIIFWALALDWLAFHNEKFRRFIKPPKLPLVKDGQPLRQNMRKELITMAELRSELRQQGVEDLGQVKVAYMEPDGRFSVITADGGGKGGGDQQKEKVF